MSTNLASKSEGMLARDWQLEPGWYLEERNGVVFLQGAGHCWARLKQGQDWTDYTLHCRLKLVCGGIHLNYRVSEAGRYFIGVREGSLYLSKESPWGRFSELAQSQPHYRLEGWHEVSICGEGGHLQVYVDGALEIDYTESEPLPRGGIAFETLDDSLAYVEDITVTLASTQVIDLELGDLFAVQEACRPWVVGAQAQERFNEAGAALHNALLQADKGNPEVIQHLAREAEAGYRDALLSGLQVGLIDRIKHYLEEERPHLPPEQYVKLAQGLERAEAYYRQALFPDLTLKEFLKLIEKIEIDLLSGTAFPDLRVKLFEIPYSQDKGITPYPPLTDRPTLLSVVVENIGLVPVDQSFVTELYVDGELAQTWKFPSEAELLDLGPEAKIQIKPGGSRIYSHEVSFPQGGQHRFTWLVDAKDKVLESDKTNNKLEIDLVWQAPPDLVVEDIWPVGTATGGQESTWNIKVTNQGKGDAKGPFLTSFVPEVPGGSYENFWTQSLPAGKSVTFTSKQKFHAWGQRMLRAMVDVGNFVAEALPNGETNNELVKAFDLKPVDLEVKNLVLNQGLESTTFTFVVVNNGPGDATLPFKVRIWPGKVVQPYPANPANYLVQPEILTVNPLKTGHSVTLKHTVPLPAGDYPVAIEADYPDPAPVYFEPNRNNNVLIQQVHIDEKYYVKIAKVEYTGTCQDDFYIYLDRSGAYWKGHVVLKLMYQNKVIHEMNIPWNELSWGFMPGSDIDPHPDHNWTAQVAVLAYAKVGNQLIPSPAPAQQFDVHFHAAPVMTGIVPNNATPGSKVQVTITGQNLVGPNNSAYVHIGFPQYEIIIGDNNIKIKKLQVSANSVQAEFDVQSNAKLGKRAVWVSHCTPVYQHLDFDIVAATAPQPTPPPPPPPTKKPDLWIQTVWSEPALPRAGEAFTVYFIGANIGSAQSPASKVKIALSGNAKQSVEIQLPSLAPGEPFKGWWPFPSGLAAGNYYFDVYLDSENKVDELNENNNWGPLSKVIY
ncbi:MAG: CARDB domain-containing protein [Desulfobulbaceae bacterium]|nr:CARDB domain-containing protein [Desulfobulbaceae bacterium]